MKRMSSKKFWTILLIEGIVMTVVGIVGLVMTSNAMVVTNEFPQAEVSDTRPIITDEPVIYQDLDVYQISGEYFSYEDSSFMELVTESSYSEEDFDYMCKVLTGECQNKSYDQQLKYGSVLLNRVADPDFIGNTIKELALAKGQYACFVDGNAYREVTETTKQAAKYLLTNGSVLPPNVVFQAEFKQGSGIYEIVDNTYFCYK